MKSEKNETEKLEKADKEFLKEYPDIKAVRDKIREEVRRNRIRRPLTFPEPNKYQY